MHKTRLVHTLSSLPISSFCASLTRVLTSSSTASRDFRLSTSRSLIRYFHASPQLLARKKEEVVVGLKPAKRGTSIRRRKNTGPAVETPYVPPKLVVPKLTRGAKTFTDRIDIFEGITIAKIAEASGESIDTLKRMLVYLEEIKDVKECSDFHPVSIDVAELIAMELGVNVRRLHFYEEGTKIHPRPPVVTVMGHVDHGKTSILDSLRQTSVAAKEAGGITQHIGAFVVRMPSGASITFLDTPGHAAFCAMRARGAAVTDIVVLVVAADDGVMPQTLEAMAHAKAANVPIVIAINKCDKSTANPEKVKVQLASEGLEIEEMGGEVQVVEVSALTKVGLDKLEEALLLQAELMELKAAVDGPAQGYVVEARMDKGRGPLVTAIVKAGTLVCGQHVVVGGEWGRIKALRDMAGKLTSQGGPAMPVEIEGVKGVPTAGDDIVVVDSKEKARMLSEGRKKKFERHKRRMLFTAPSEEEKSSGVELAIIVKADVQGSVQPVTEALRALNSPQVFVKIIYVGVGPICQSDLDLAKTFDACIVGFNIRKPPNCLSKAAARANIKIKLHRVIYHLLEDIGNLIVEKAPGTMETQVTGEAQVLSIFELKGRSKAKGDDIMIAGCRVVDGRFMKSSTMRLLRSGEVVFEGLCTSLKREKQDVDAVGKGTECGLVLENFRALKVGDVIQCLEQVNRKPKFISSESGAARIEC